MNDLSYQAFKIRNLIIRLALSYSPFPLATVRPVLQGSGDPTNIEFFSGKDLDVSQTQK